MPKHEILISADIPGVDEGLRSFLRKVIRTALEAEGVDVPCEVSVLVTGDGGIRQVNLDMRGVDAPTDVLSFPMFDLTPGDKPGPEDADPATELVPLGDMCISLERAKAQEIPQRFWSRLQKGEVIEFEGRTLTPDMVLGEKRRGLSVTYATDTRPVPVISEYAKENDLFICEGMYGEKDKAVKAREYKHMTFQEAANLGKEANPREMWLTHYSPSLTRPEEYMEKVRKIFPRAKAARDGWSAELTFEEEEESP